MGIYSVLKALTLIQTTLYIHFKGIEILNLKKCNNYRFYSYILHSCSVYRIIRTCNHNDFFSHGVPLLQVREFFFLFTFIYNKKNFPILLLRSSTMNFYVVFPFILNGNYKVLHTQSNDKTKKIKCTISL